MLLLSVSVKGEQTGIQQLFAPVSYRGYETRVTSVQHAVHSRDEVRDDLTS